MNPSPCPTLELRGVTCLRNPDAPLRDLTLSFSPGCFHAILGDAQSGKDTLLRVLGMLEEPDTGEILLSGVSTRAVASESQPDLRARRFGFVFTAPFLLSSFSVIENVAMPLFKISQSSPEEARLRTETVLDFVGLTDEAQDSVDDLPIGAQFRAALARGLVHEPSILIVEDLDGTLAGEELRHFTDLLRRASQELGTTVIATASAALTRKPSDRILEIDGGAIRSDSEFLQEPGA